MFGYSLLRHFDSGNRFAIGLLLCCTIWLALTVSGLFRISPVHFPGWAGLIVALGILAGPAAFTFMQSLHWGVRLFVAIMFLGCAFVFPWLYNQSPILFWLTALLAYVEVFGVIPLVLRIRRSREERPQRGSGRSA